MGAVSGQDLDRLLLELYGGVAEHGRFAEVLRRLCDTFHCHMGGIHEEGIPAGTSRVEVVGSATIENVADCQREYDQHWAGKNTWLQQGLRQLVATGFCDGDQAVTAQELLAMPYYRHFLRRLDIRHGVGLGLVQGGPDRVSLVSLNRSPGAGEFANHERKLLKALRPHLVNAYRICRMAAAASWADASLGRLLDASPLGTFLLDAEGRILRANATAEHMLAHGVVALRGHNDALLLRQRAGQCDLRGGLAKISAGQALRHSFLVSHQGGGGQRVVLHLCALTPPGTTHDEVRIAGFVCRLGASAARQIDLTALQAVLALTPAEARFVLALRAHSSLEVTCSALHISPETGRSHLKHCFGKTGTGRQAELMQLVERIVLSIPSWGGPS